MEKNNDNKIYGLYWPKNFNGGKPFEFENEYSLYHDMNRLYGNYSWDLIIDKENVEESPFSYCIDCKDNEYIIENMIYFTKRFGVSFPEPQEGKHIVCAESLAWYKYFNDYFENILNHGQRDHLGKEIIRPLLEKGLDISRLMPDGDWHDLLETDYYLFEILLGHDLNDLKEQAKKEDRIEDLVGAFYQLNNMDLGTLAFKFGPTPYLTNLFEHDYRPADEELDDLVNKLIINKTKIHGEYCTDDIFADEDVLHIKYLSEPELYNAIKHYDEEKDNDHEDLDFSGIESLPADKKLYGKEFLMYQTKRFGVEFPDNAENKPIEESESYKAWYEFYDNYYDRFSEETRDWMIYKIAIRRAAKADYSKYLPNGNWQDYKVTSNEKIFMINKDMKKTSL